MDVTAPLPSILIHAILFTFVTQINLFLTYIYLFSRVFFCFCYHMIFFSLLASLTSFSNQFYSLR